MSLPVRTLFPSQGPALRTSAKSNYLPKAPPPVHSGGRWGAGVVKSPVYEFGQGDTTQSITTPKSHFPHLQSSDLQSPYSHRVIKSRRVLQGWERREGELRKCGFVDVEM